jgi:hypothetical protein
MRNFRQAVDDCCLQDLGWSGTAYIRDNRQAGCNNVKARLDRAFANAQFLARLAIRGYCILSPRSQIIVMCLLSSGRD